MPLGCEMLTFWWNKPLIFCKKRRSELINFSPLRHQLNTCWCVDEITWFSIGTICTQLHRMEKPSKMSEALSQNVINYHSEHKCYCLLMHQCNLNTFITIMKCTDRYVFKIELDTWVFASKILSIDREPSLTSETILYNQMYEVIPNEICLLNLPKFTT